MKLVNLSQKQFIPNHLSVNKAITYQLIKKKRMISVTMSLFGPLLRKKISHLSVGELRYLEIKIVLWNPSKFVLLDEPYNGLSPLMVDMVNDMIKRIRIKRDYDNRS